LPAPGDGSVEVGVGEDDVWGFPAEFERSGAFKLPADARTICLARRHRNR